MPKLPMVHPSGEKRCAWAMGGQRICAGRPNLQATWFENFTPPDIEGHGICTATSQRERCDLRAKPHRDGLWREALARHLAPSGKCVLLLERGDCLPCELPLTPARLHEERVPGDRL